MELIKELDGMDGADGMEGMLASIASSSLCGLKAHGSPWLLVPVEVMELIKELDGMDGADGMEGMLASPRTLETIESSLFALKAQGLPRVYTACCTGALIASWDIWEPSVLSIDGASLMISAALSCSASGFLPVGLARSRRPACFFINSALTIAYASGSEFLRSFNP